MKIHTQNFTIGKFTNEWTMVTEELTLRKYVASVQTKKKRGNSSLPLFKIHKSG